MRQYLDLCQRIIDEGVWVENERTGKKCLTVINADLEYGGEEFPLLTTKQTFWKSAIAEMLGYLKGYDNAADFRELGTKTWDANANNNEAWLNNPYRKGEDDMGYVYGAIARDWKAHDGTSIDLLQQIYDSLCTGVDTRGEILTFYNPGVFHLGCLRPCLHSHHFSILDGTLYLNSTQRSADMPLGVPFNMVQCYFLLRIMAKICNLKIGKVYHKIVNAHIYEDQLELLKDQLTREPYELPKLGIRNSINTLDDVMNMTTDDLMVYPYTHHPKIVFPFSV